MEEIRTEETNIKGYLAAGCFCWNCRNWVGPHSCSPIEHEVYIDTQAINYYLSELWEDRSEIDLLYPDDSDRSYLKEEREKAKNLKGYVVPFDVKTGEINLNCSNTQLEWDADAIPDLIIGPTPNIDIGPIDSPSLFHSFKFEFGPVPSFSPIEFVGPAPSFSPIEFGYKIPSTIWN